MNSSLIDFLRRFREVERENAAQESWDRSASYETALERRRSEPRDPRSDRDAAATDAP